MARDPGPRPAQGLSGYSWLQVLLGRPAPGLGHVTSHPWACLEFQGQQRGPRIKVVFSLSEVEQMTVPAAMETAA